MPLDTVLDYVSSLLNGEAVEARASGRHGYTATHVVGPVLVWSSPGRVDCCVEISGSACEELGLESVAVLYFGLGLKASRVDVAVDHCPFTPSQLREHWMRDQVRSAARVPNVEALEARGLALRPEYQGVRSCRWHESGTGATFSMGSRQSSQMARCYDTRGFTRLELELKGRRAAYAARDLFTVVEDRETFADLALGLVRDFVDFVDTDADSNPSRAPLLSFWDAFIGAVARARVALEGAPARTLDDALAWFEHQVAPVYALLREALGSDVLDRVADAGRMRWRRRHVAMLPPRAVLGAA